MPLRSPTWLRQGHGYWFPYKGEKPVGEKWLSMDASATGRLVQATTDSTGKIVLRFPSAFGVGTWAELVTTITGARPTARFARRRTSGELVILYEASGGISRVTTQNEGGAFSVATTVTSAGKYAAMDLTPSGAEATAWISGAAIKFKVLDAFGGTVLAELAAVASGVAEDAIGIVCRSDGSMVIAYRNTGGAIITVVSTNGGQTWA